jgi:uncharacterized phosphosugar-binding protein
MRIWAGRADEPWREDPARGTLKDNGGPLFPEASVLAASSRAGTLRKPVMDGRRRIGGVPSAPISVRRLTRITAAAMSVGRLDACAIPERRLGQVASEYLHRIQGVLQDIAEEETDKIRQAALWAADAIRHGRWVNLFGSGHSALPALDAFPRYGSFVGFRPVLDPRLLWWVPSGPGGAPELLWIERQPGYIAQFLDDFDFASGEVAIVYSHGGLNAAPVEAAQYFKAHGLRVIAVTSGDNHRTRAATHPSGQKLGDVADLVIDTHVPAEDALVQVSAGAPPVAAGSTVATVAVTMALIAETATQLTRMGMAPTTFVSPNVQGIAPDHNARVYAEYRRWRRASSGQPESNPHQGT